MYRPAHDCSWMALGPSGTAAAASSFTTDEPAGLRLTILVDCKAWKEVHTNSSHPRKMSTQMRNVVTMPRETHLRMFLWCRPAAELDNARCSCLGLRIAPSTCTCHSQIAARTLRFMESMIAQHLGCTPATLMLQCGPARRKLVKSSWWTLRQSSDSLPRDSSTTAAWPGIDPKSTWGW